MFFRDGKPQPDNYEGLKAGKLAKVSDPSGLTVEGLQVRNKFDSVSFKLQLKIKILSYKTKSVLRSKLLVAVR